MTIFGLNVSCRLLYWYSPYKDECDDELFSAYNCYESLFILLLDRVCLSLSAGLFLLI